MKNFFAVRSCRAIILRGLAVLLLLCSFQEPDVADEYTIKGMFIYNFTKYIDWSSSGIKNNFVIAVYGRSEIIKSLEQIALSKKVSNKNIEIKRISNLDDASDCQIIFIPRSNNT